MTIAIGALCQKGLIVAADTRIVRSDGATYDARKITSTVADNGTYVIANSSEDGNASTTLVSQICADLKVVNPKTLAEAEDTISNRMTAWASAFTKSIPSMELIVGARIDAVPIPFDNTGGGLGLYLCIPPNTVVRKQFFDGSKGYIATGNGGAVTDPIASTLFPFLPSARHRLAEISYLMYRAKKDCASFCGGKTNAVLIREDDSEPVWIKPEDMAGAEGNGGPLLDRSLMMAASAMIRQSDQTITQFSLALAEAISQNGLYYRALAFHSHDGEEIT